MIAQKAYYSLEEVTNKFKVSLADIEYMVQQGILEMSVRFAEIAIDNLKMKLLTHNKINSDIIRRNKVLITKPKTLTRTDACALFRRKEAIIPEFKNDNNLKVLHFIKGSDIFVKYDDMVIMQEELSKLSDNSIFYVSDFNGAFKHKNNYQKVICNKVEFSFGEIQAQVIKQLYNAAKTNSPWVSGKVLLKDAGSDTERFHSIFRRHPKWRKLISSDKKGNYCLNIKSIKN